MASSIRSCFSQGVGCTASHAKSFFTNPGNKFSVFFQRAEGRDKVCKLLDPIFDGAGEIATAAGAAPDVILGISKGRATIKAGRDVNSLFNIFACIVAVLVNQLKNIWALTKGIYKNKEVILKDSGTTVSIRAPRASLNGLQENDRIDIEFKKTNVNDTSKHTDRAVTRNEKLFALGSNFFKAIASAAYIMAFGICRPIANVDKYIRDKDGRSLVSMSESAKTLGKVFPTVMVANHLGALFGGGCEIGFQKVAFDRAVSSPVGDHNKAYTNFVSAIRKETVSLIEKSLEFLMDIVYLLGRTAPAWFRVPVNIGVGLMGCYKVWISER